MSAEFIPHRIKLTRSILQGTYENITYLLNKEGPQLDSDVDTSRGIIALLDVRFKLASGMTGYFLQCLVF